MITAFSRALSDIFSRTLIGILMKSALVSLLLFVVGGVGIYAALDYSDLLEGPLSSSWVDAEMARLIYTIAAISIVVIAGWFLFRVVIIAVIGIFADDIVDAVEARHYPDGVTRGPGIVRSTHLALRSLLRLVWINLLFSPLYIILLVTGVGPAIAFLIANGWAFGRDLDDAVRYRGAPGGKRPPKLSSNTRFLLGLGATAATTLPVLQFIVPVLSVAMAAHLSHEARR